MGNIVPENTIRNQSKDRFDETGKEMVILRAVVLLLLDQLNTLRDLHSLPTFSKAQVIAAIKAKVDSGEADNS